MNDILEEMRKFKVIETDTCWHCGDLYEHSIWTMLYLDEALINNSSMILPFRGNITIEHMGSKYPEIRRLLNIAALFHDIGKIGDGLYEYVRKPEHPYTGMCYTLTGKINSDTHQINFHAALFDMGLSSDKIVILSGLIYSHWDFGYYLHRAIYEYGLYQAANEYINLTINKIRSIDPYLKCITSKDDLILYFEMLMLVSAADIIASKPYPVDVKSNIFNITSPVGQRVCHDSVKKSGILIYGNDMRLSVLNQLNDSYGALLIK